MQQEQLYQELASLSEWQLQQVTRFIAQLKATSLDSQVEFDNSASETALYTFAAQNLSNAYSEDEPDYPVSLIKEHNSEYEPR